MPPPPPPMKGFNVYLKAGSQSCQITLATVTGTGNDSNDRRQGVKERSDFLMSAVTEVHIHLPSHGGQRC